MFCHYQEANEIINRPGKGARPFTILWKKTNLWCHLLSPRDSRASFLCKRSWEVPFIAPGIISAADYWTFSNLSLKESLKGLS